MPEPHSNPEGWCTCDDCTAHAFGVNGHHAGEDCRDGDPNTWHVVPVGDAIGHDTHGDGCPCGPLTEAVFRDDGSNGWVIVHASLDGREVRHA